MMKTTTLQRWLSGTRAIEARLGAAVERTARLVAGSDAPSALDLVDRAGDALARQVQPAGRGRYVCPFNRAVVTFVAPAAEDRARFDAICEGPPAIGDRFRQRLASAGVHDAALTVEVVYVSLSDAAWAEEGFHLGLSRHAPAEVCPGPALRVDALVTHGTADRGAYTFTSLPIAIGRGAEVRDAQLQLVRVNHVVFSDGVDAVNRSVSRRHARIELDPASGRLRLIDDGSAQGTSIIRDGRGLSVPRGSRGLGLQTDDEIVLGQARLRVRVTATA